MSRSPGWRRRGEKEKEREGAAWGQPVDVQTDTEQVGKQDMPMEREVKKKNSGKT